MSEPCFMCDPSILEDGQRCATGAPICDRHRDELTGQMRPADRATQAERERHIAVQRMRIAEDKADDFRQAWDRDVQAFRADNAALAARLEAVTAARDILGGHMRDWHDAQHSGPWMECDHNECTETRHFLAAGQPAPVEGATCRCGRGLIYPGNPDPWCEGCTMSAKTCDCVPPAVGKGI